MASIVQKTRGTLVRLATRAADSHPGLRRALDRRLSSAGHRARTQFYAQFVAPGDLVFDIGANVGNRTAVFEALGAVVVAVEPQAACQRELARRYGRKERVHLVRAGLGARIGTLDLYVGSAHTLTTMSSDWMEATRRSGRFSGHTWTRQGTVPVTTLDELIREYGRPGFCKIDVEGYEVEVLEGLSQPLGVVSLEFAAEYLNKTKAALELLSTLGAREFNLSLGESYVLHNADWVGAEAIVAALTGLADPLAFGDVYARFAS
jgi:FkbM family methyltransferase